MSTETAGPLARVTPGCRVSIILRDEGRVTAGEGTLGAERGFGIEVDLQATNYLRPEAEVILAAGDPGERAVALARFKRMRGNTAVFMRQSPWRPVDARAFARYPARLTATIAESRHDFEAEARTLDISLGGMAVSLPGRVDFDELEVSLGEHAGPLPCRVVSRRRAEGTTVLHLAFGELGEEAIASVEKLVARLRIQAEKETPHAA